MKTNPTVMRGVALLAAHLMTAGTCPAKLNVVATTADLGAIARAVGGADAEVVVLARPVEDAHFVDARPSHIVKLARADALVEGGAELESGWLPPLLEGARNAKIAAGQPGRIAAAAGLELREVPAVLDRSKGDLHAMGNPHFMMDPLNGRAVALRIAAAFAELDPQHAEAYRERGAAFAARIDAKLKEWQDALKPSAGRRAVAYHNSWPYFAARFGLRIDLFLEPKPGVPPSPAHLTALVAQMKADGVRAILVEPHVDRKTAETVAGRTGAALVEFTQFPGGVPGTDGGYIELFDALIARLAAAFAAGK